MNYVSKILFDGEHVQYNGRVHWVVYVPGAFYICLALYLAYKFSVWPEIPWIQQICVSAIRKFPSLEGFPSFLTVIMFLYGTFRIIKAFLIANFTELVVTNHRIIAKFGVYETTTFEMDKGKIAGVTIHQSVWGKMLGYGTIDIRGFAGNITGFPVLSRPYDIQKYISGARF